MTVSIRWRTRLAVSGLVVQMGVSTFMASAGVMASTVLHPMTGWTEQACGLSHAHPVSRQPGPAFGNGATIVVGHGPGSGKADGGIRPQPYVPAPSMDYDSLDPRLAA
jgi:hypothetical protein